MFIWLSSPCLVKSTDIITIIIIRFDAALRAAHIDWIVGPGYSSGGYILGCSQCLASCLRHSARIGPDLLCHCHPLSVICHPLDWIVGPHYSLGWVHFEGKCIFELAFLKDSIQELYATVFQSRAKKVAW